MPLDYEKYKTPGQLLIDLLEDRGWTRRFLAMILESDETGINKLIADKRPVSAELAIKLEEVFDVPASVFLNLQSKFDLAVARIVAKPDLQRATRASLFADLPLAEMLQRGWIHADGIKDFDAVETSLCRFFGVENLADIEVLAHAAKKTKATEKVTPSQLAWLYRVKKIASEMLVPRYNELAGRRVIEKLKALILSAEGARSVPAMLSEAGVRFLVVETLPKAKIDGVCFWLDELSPVIALSCRFDRIDNFWFVLRHELEHMIRGHGKAQIVIDADLDGAGAHDMEEVSDEEHVANAAASEFCVPKKMMDKFVSRKAPFFAEADIKAFASMLRVHPGLIAGQLQHITGRYDRFKGFQEKIRLIVAGGGAVVDGWGDIAPVEL